MSDVCERCGRGIKGEVTPFEDNVCEPCVNEMIGGGSGSDDHSLKDSMKEEFDFGKGEYKK